MNLISADYKEARRLFNSTAVQTYFFTNPEAKATIDEKLTSAFETLAKVIEVLEPYRVSLEVDKRVAFGRKFLYTIWTESEVETQLKVLDTCHPRLIDACQVMRGIVEKQPDTLAPPPPPPAYEQAIDSKWLELFKRQQGPDKSNDVVAIAVRTLHFSRCPKSGESPC
jgi:hypothetical protein